MKKLLLLLLVSSPLVFAEDRGNGGDDCENRIIEVRDDIELWILKGGHEDLNYRDSLNSQTYKRRMLNSMKSGMISCVGEKLYIGRVEKTCINYPDSGKILCNFKRFNETKESRQYSLVHHEYAGLSEIETNNGNEESDYFYSDQITEYLENTTVKKLGIKESKTFKMRDLLIDCRYETEVFKNCLPSIGVPTIVHSARSSHNPYNNLNRRIAKDKYTQGKIQKNADNICKMKGYTSAHSYKTVAINNSDIKVEFPELEYYATKRVGNGIFTNPIGVFNFKYYHTYSVALNDITEEFVAYANDGHRDSLYMNAVDDKNYYFIPAFSSVTCFNLLEK